MRRQAPVCPTCLERHWEIMPTAAATRHCHLRPSRFRAAVAAGEGPAPWAHEIHTHPRYHVNELDRWMSRVA